MDAVTLNTSLNTGYTPAARTDSSGGNFGMALQAAFSYSEVRGANSLMAAAEYDLSIDPELEAMYVVSAAHKLQQPITMLGQLPDEEYSSKFHDIIMSHVEMEKSGKYLEVPIAEGGLDEFVGYIRTSLEEGIPLRQALEQQIDRYSRWEGGEWCAPCALDYDMFTIDPDTGEVAYSQVKGRVQCPYEEQKMMDYHTALAMADDIATVLRYSYFREDGDNGINVERLLKGVAERSTKYSTERYEAKYNNRRGSMEWYAMNWERLRAEDGGKDYKSMIEALVKLYAEHLKAEEEREGGASGTAEPADSGKAGYDAMTAVIAAKVTDKKAEEFSELEI